MGGGSPAAVTTNQPHQKKEWFTALLLPRSSLKWNGWPRPQFDYSRPRPSSVRASPTGSSIRRQSPPFASTIPCSVDRSIAACHRVQVSSAPLDAMQLSATLLSIRSPHVQIVSAEDFRGNLAPSAKKVKTPTFSTRELIPRPSGIPRLTVISDTPVGCAPWAVPGHPRHFEQANCVLLQTPPAPRRPDPPRIPAHRWPSPLLPFVPNAQRPTRPANRAADRRLPSRPMRNPVRCGAALLGLLAARPGTWPSLAVAMLDRLVTRTRSWSGWMSCIG
jgi:hypothetical protein